MIKITIDGLNYEVVPVMARNAMPNGEIARYAKSIGQSFSEYAAEQNAKALAKELLNMGAIELGEIEEFDHTIYTAKVYVLKKEM